MCRWTDLGADGFQLLFYFRSAVEVIDAVDACIAVGDKAANTKDALARRARQDCGGA